MHYLDGYITAYSYFCLFVDVTSTNSISYNGELTYEHVCSLPTFVNILLGRFTTHSYSSKALIGTFEADYVNHNNHRKHTNHSNNRVYIQTRVLGSDGNLRYNLTMGLQWTTLFIIGELWFIAL